MRHFLFLSSLIVFLASCKSATAPTDQLSDHSTTDTSSIRRLFPLAVGNYWVYEYFGYDTDSSIIFNEVRTVEVIDTLSFRGLHAFLMDYGTGRDQFVRYFSSQDLFLMHLNDSVAYHSLHYPLVLGQDYLMRDTFGYYNPPLAAFSVKDYNRPVRVAAGNFSCVYIEEATIYDTPATLDTTVVYHYYYCPDVGLVKQESFQKVNGSVTWQRGSSEELQYYHVH